MIVFRKITPSSESTPYKQDYEYMIIWLFGGVRQWLFSSTDNRRDDDFKSIVIDSVSDFRSVPNARDISIDLSVNSLQKDEFDYVSTLFESPRVMILKKDGETIPVSIKKGRKRTDSMQKGFEIDVTIELQEPELLNV